MKSNNIEMKLTDHLKELRNRIIICILSLTISFLIIFNFADKIVNVLTSLGTMYGYKFVYIASEELFMQYIKVSLIGGICLASPILLFHIGRFIAPGLKKNEKAVMFFTMIFGLLFFLVGVLFAYKISIPFMLSFFYRVNTSSNINATISINNYISLLSTVFLVFGAVFELPVVTVILTVLGLVKPEFLIKGRSISIVIIFIIAAVITPPDIVSQILVALPMVILYQLSIFLCYLFSKDNKVANLFLKVKNFFKINKKNTEN